MSFKLQEQSEAGLSGAIAYIQYCGLLPEPTLRGKIYSNAVLVFAILSVLQLLGSVPIYAADIDSVSMIIYNAALYSATPLAHLCLRPIHSSIQELVEGSAFSYDYRDEVMHPIQESILKDTKNMKFTKLSHLLPYMNTIMVSNLIVASILDKLAFGQRYFELYPIWYPSWVNQDFLAVDLATFLLQLSSMTLTGFTIFSGFASCCIFYNHVTSEMSLLGKALELVGERAREVATREGLPLHVAYRRVTRLCAQHHIHILSYYNVIQPALQRIYTMIYFVGLILLTCTGFAFTSDNTAVKIKFVVITLLQLSFLFFISWFAEEVAAKAELVNQAAYGVDWLSLPKNCISTLRIVLMVSQQPLVVRTSFGQPVDLAGYMSLIKASYSYFNMMLVATSGEEMF